MRVQSFSKLIESRVIASIDEYTPTPLPVTKIDIWFRHGVIKKVIVINYNLITFCKIIECNCN